MISSIGSLIRTGIALGQSLNVYTSICDRSIRVEEKREIGGRRRTFSFTTIFNQKEILAMSDSNPWSVFFPLLLCLEENQRERFHLVEDQSRRRMASTTILFLLLSIFGVFIVDGYNCNCSCCTGSGCSLVNQGSMNVSTCLGTTCSDSCKSTYSTCSTGSSSAVCSSESLFQIFFVSLLIIFSLMINHLIQNLFGH